MQLRDYQRDMIDRCRVAYGGGARAPLVVVPTGGGKTVIGSYATAGAVDRGGRVLWLAHRRELIDQAAERMVRPAGRVMAGRPVDASAPIQVASVDTLQARGDLPEADLVVVDEAHHATANKIRTILERYPRARLLGLTATPQRSDGTALGDVFDTLVEGPSTADMIAAGHLVEVDVVGPAEAGQTLALDPVQAWLRYADGRPGFVFARTVKQSKEITAGLQAAGVVAAHVDGTTAKGARDNTVGLFRRGAVDVLCSVGVFTEGTDLPRATVVLLARGCEHLGTYLQMVGRGLRPCPGKGRALVVDLLGVVHKHGLPDDPREWSLAGKAVKDPRDKPAALTQCLGCGAVWRAGARRVCARCGWEMPAPPAPKVSEREMVDLRDRLRPHVQGLRPGAPAEAKARKLAELRTQAAARGYKPGWVVARYRAIYGHAP